MLLCPGLESPPERLIGQARLKDSVGQGTSTSLRMIKKKNKKTPASAGALCFVPRTGIEPAHPCEWQILSLLRLPIPPPGLI